MKLSEVGASRVAHVRASPIDATLLSERVYVSLREEIFRQALRPGFRLDVRDIASAYDTSVAPVRHALARLHEEGLVEIAPRRGTFVSRVGPRDVREIFQIRRMIETGAVQVLGARLPAEASEKLAVVIEQMEALAEGESFRDYDAYIRLDAEFHRIPLAALANARLLRLYEGLHAHIHVARGLYPVASKRASSTLAEHRAIWAAYQEHDVSAARQALLTHLENAEADLRRRLDGG
ncbi:MAG TPA: GntR family transcriptional regulator [Chloroflexota bacterium]|nr:GntR family transcriptional regulator [Chloroflexota bacterium]